jgi:molybdopterin synthase sulfur carrier subunit
MSTLLIPQVLRTETGGAGSVEVEGETVGQAIEELVELHPGLRNRLLTPDGDLHRFVNLYRNGEDVRYLGGLETPLGEEDEVRLLPAIAGG